jgi:hypothetical protein
VSRRKRTPIGGLGRNISPRAVELWQQYREMVEQGSSEDDRSVRDLAGELHLELGLKLWHPRVADVGSEPPGDLCDPFHLRNWRTVIEIRRCLVEERSELLWPRVAREEREDSEVGDAEVLP